MQSFLSVVGQKDSSKAMTTGHPNFQTAPIGRAEQGYPRQSFHFSSPIISERYNLENNEPNSSNSVRRICTVVLSIQYHPSFTESLY